MRVFFFGTKTFGDLKKLDEIIKQSGFKITTVVSISAIGVSECAEQWAARKSIPIIAYTHDEFLRGDACKKIDAAIIIWDGKLALIKNILSNLKKAKVNTHEIVSKDIGKPRSHHLYVWNGGYG